MWYLEAFDKRTEFLVRDHPLPGLATATLQEILHFDDSCEIDGINYPPEAGGYDVPQSKLPELAEYLPPDFVVDESCDYQVGYYRE
ncbi:hypothetical protein AB0E01_10520 [Nocardia vinacea]|uniref:DUF7683 domain-containing protein n=1 Tax=Nocardia vinacea TaxID=96468 RepID=UPI0033C4929F